MSKHRTIILSPRFDLLKRDPNLDLHTYPGGRAQLEREIVSLVSAEESEFQSAWNKGGLAPKEIRLMEGGVLRAIVGSSLGVLNDASLIELAGNYLLLLDVRDALRLAQNLSDFWQHALAEGGIPEKAPAQRLIWPWAILLAAAAIVLITFILKPRPAEPDRDLAKALDLAEQTLVHEKLADLLRESYSQNIILPLVRNADFPNRDAYESGSALVLREMNQAIQQEFSEASPKQRTRSFDQAVVALAAQILRNSPDAPVQFVNGNPSAFYQTEAAIRQLNWLIPTASEASDRAAKISIVVSNAISGTLNANWIDAAGHPVVAQPVSFSDGALPVPLFQHFTVRQCDAGIVVVQQPDGNEAHASLDSFIVAFSGGPGQLSLLAAEGDPFLLDPRAAGAEWCFEFRLVHGSPKTRVQFTTGADGVLTQSSSPPLVTSTQWQTVLVPTTVERPGHPRLGLTILLLNIPGETTADCQIEIRHAFLRQIVQFPASGASPGR